MNYWLTIEYNPATHNLSPGWAEGAMDRLCREVIIVSPYSGSVQYKSWWWGSHQCKSLRVKRVL